MRGVMIASALLIAVTGPAGAALGVFGSTIARECYEAALAGSGSGAALCEHALNNDQMTPRDRAATFVNRGIIYNASRQLDLSLADFNAALAIDANLGEAYLNRGNTHFYRRQFDLALADYSKAIELKIPNLDYAYYNRALVFAAQNKLAEARADLAAALAISPQLKPAMDQMAVVERLMAASVAPQPMAPSPEALQAPSAAPAPSATPAPSAQ
jgi:tetratricopeptide (TPR) repeat protein